LTNMNFMTGADHIQYARAFGTPVQDAFA
jgi:hypothetical protein